MTPEPSPDQIAARLARQYAASERVEAVALGGSLVGERRKGRRTEADTGSDIDLYVYVRDELPLAFRRGIAQAGAVRAEVDKRFWEAGDEWIDGETGIHVDVMFRQTGWIEEQLDRVLVRHEASVGYSTCFWYNVLTSLALYDRSGWFAALQAQARRPYPPELQRAILAKNWPILSGAISSYRAQLLQAVTRKDRVSLNHRVAAFLASYFDLLFAANRLPHPGEKRLVARALDRCRLLPAGFPSGVDRLLSATAVADGELLAALDALVDGLEALLCSEGLLPPTNAGREQETRGAEMPSGGNGGEPIEHRRDGYAVTTDQSRLDVGRIHQFLSGSAYWALGRSLETVVSSLEHSLCFGVYDGHEQVGFCRVVTDYATFAWLCDVFILPSHRGLGLGKWMIERVVAHPQLAGLRLFVLATRDAHELYRRHGEFDGLAAPERWMQRRTDR